MYASDPTWVDIVPIPQDDGLQPLAQIAYTEEYAEAMAYLRAVMAKEEKSERVLDITEHVIGLNPSHYTVWLYRARTLFELEKDLKKELEFLNEKALAHQKNYQIWHHRQLMMEKLMDPSGEHEFIARMFEKDDKNYHVWSYRQWLVRRFNLWETPEEMKYVNELLAKDVRNNSAWNHRFFLVFGRGSEVEQDIVDREIQAAEEAIILAPQNPSPWNYLRGVLGEAKLPLSTIEKLCTNYAPLENPNKVTSSHALELLADICEEQGEVEGAAKAFGLLAEKYDPIRTNYWTWRKVGLAKK